MAGGREKGKLHRLPSGKHGLPPEYVAQNHRERLAAGVIAAVAEHGLRDAGVSQIAAAAGVSRLTYYEYFADKEACYFDTYRLIEESLVRIVAEAGESKGSWSAKVRARVQGLVEILAANPDLVRFTLLAPPTAGGAALERRREFLRRLLAALTDGTPVGRGHATPTDTELEALAGSVSVVLAQRVTADEAHRLPGDVPQLVEMILIPIIGRPRAAAESEKVAV